VDRENKAVLLKNLIPVLERDFSTGCCLVLEEMDTERGMAKESANEESAFIVDLLRFGSFSIYRRGLRVPHGIAVQSQYLRPSTTAVILSSDGSFGTSYSLSGQIAPFEVSRENTRVLKNLGLTQLAERRANGTLTKLDEQIIRSIHWFAESQIQYNEENELLNLIVCLEMFLNPGENESISGSIADGVVMLLFTDVDQRLYFRQFIKQAYHARSRVTHGRNLDGRIDVPQLGIIVFNLILVILKTRNKWTSVQELQQYIIKLRLA
jgi:hypothetical protein